MPHNPEKFFEDILIALRDLEQFCAGRTFADFQRTRQFQASVSG